MGRTLATLTLLMLPTLSLGGCSRLYDPDRLAAAADAAPDTAQPPDSDNPVLESVAPSSITEGAGVGGSRQALVVISGRNLVPGNMTVMITPAEGMTRAPMLEVDAAKVEVAANGLAVAVPITLPVDPSLAAGDSIVFDVQIKQDGSAGPVMSPALTGQLTLRGLDELEDGTATTPISIPSGGKEYSRIDVVSRTIVPADRSGPIVLRSRSSVKIAQAISVNADPIDAMNTSAKSLGGPGAGTGGLGGTGLGGSGEPGTGPSPGQTPSASARFESSDLGLGTLASPNRGSGGAGGNGAVVGGRGGRGGGGGGSISISADGDLQIDKITAQGTAGEAGALGGADGGGGSGGVILVRAGGALIASDLNVAGGGNGQPGRARYDAGGAATLAPGALGTDHYRGPMFVGAPLITRAKAPALTISGKALSSFGYYTVDPAGKLGPIVTSTIGPNGTVTLTLQQSLDLGLNQVCLLVAGAMAASDTSNCIDVAFLP